MGPKRKPEWSGLRSQCTVRKRRQHREVRQKRRGGVADGQDGRDLHKNDGDEIFFTSVTYVIAWSTCDY